MASRQSQEDERHQWIIPGIFHIFNAISVFIVTCLYIFKEMKSPFWDAVFTSDLNRLKSFLRTKLTLRYEEVRRSINTPLNERRVESSHGFSGISKSISVEERLWDLTDKSNDLFEAAKWGMYDEEGGVDEVLTTNDFPSTIRDDKGWTVLHYIAIMKYDDGRPVWEIRNIRRYIMQHKPFLNAIDHWGQTALHLLAQHPRGSLETVFVKSRRIYNVPEAWLQIACILIKCGCDPRIKNHDGRLAGDIAWEYSNIELAELLGQECALSGDVDYTVTKDRVPELAEASRKGNTKHMMDLLTSHVSTHPKPGQEDPLMEALRHCQRDAVFLLLSAGAPLSSLDITSLQQMEEAPYNHGLPLLMSALLRKDCADRLANESEKVFGFDTVSRKLKSHIKTMRLHFIKSKSNILWSHRTFYASPEVLHRAVKLRLAFTCLLIGQSNVYIEKSLELQD